MQLNMKPIVSDITPNIKCKDCKHYTMVNDPSYYIDSFHYYCSCVKKITRDGTLEPECIDGYYWNKDADCKYYAEAQQGSQTYQ